jgi:hypothetical protein
MSKMQMIYIINLAIICNICGCKGFSGASSVGKTAQGSEDLAQKFRDVRSLLRQDIKRGKMPHSNGHCFLEITKNDDFSVANQNMKVTIWTLKEEFQYTYTTFLLELPGRLDGTITENIEILRTDESIEVLARNKHNSSAYGQVENLSSLVLRYEGDFLASVGVAEESEIPTHFCDLRKVSLFGP